MLHSKHLCGMGFSPFSSPCKQRDSMAAPRGSSAVFQRVVGSLMYGAGATRQWPLITVEESFPGGKGDPWRRRQGDPQRRTGPPWPAADFHGGEQTSTAGSAGAPRPWRTSMVGDGPPWRSGDIHGHGGGRRETSRAAAADLHGGRRGDREIFGKDGSQAGYRASSQALSPV